MSINPACSIVGNGKAFRLLVAIVAVYTGASFATAAETAPADKTPAKRALVPAMQPVEDVPNLPRVLLIGDSISIGYTLPVRDLLKGKANVHRVLENCGDTQRGLKSLDKWLGDKKWDVIHFNFGLHDLKYLNEKGALAAPDKGKQVAPLPEYETNLQQLVERLKKSGAKVIWCSTTPVPERANGRIKDSEVEYNKVAAKIARANGIAIDDLHAIARAQQAEIQKPHDVHFTAEGSKVLAKAVAESIEQALRQ